MTTSTDVKQDLFDPWTAISGDEFRERQRRVREAVADKSLDGVLVWSRGGSGLDMKADIQYLTNHYSQHPYCGDEIGFAGSARSHSALFVPAEGPSTLIVDTQWWRRDLVVADDIRESITVPAAAAEAISSLGCSKGRLALVGHSYMSAAAYVSLIDALPEVEFVRADRMVEDFRIHKSDAEVEIIRRSAALGSTVMDTLMEAVAENGTEAEAVGEAVRVLMREGGVLWDAQCTSGPVSHAALHARLPSADPNRRLKRGEIFHVDLLGGYGGYLFDLARSCAVGGSPTAAQLALLEAPIEGVELLCHSVRPGLRGRDLYEVGRDWIMSSEVGRRVMSQRSGMQFPGVGHGVGLMWEPPWIYADNDTLLEPNMFLSFEYFLSDEALGGAYFEENGLVTTEGFEVLTTARRRWW